MEIIVYFGMALILIGNIWLIVKAFMESFLWGLGVFFLPLIGLFFVIGHWNEAKKPFLLAVAGVALVILGSVLGTPTPQVAA